MLKVFRNDQKKFKEEAKKGCSTSRKNSSSYMYTILSFFARIDAKKIDILCAILL